MKPNAPPTISAPVVWCLLAAVLFGASTPASKWLLESGLDPVTLAGLLYAGAGLASLPWALNSPSPTLRRKEDRKKLLGAVLFGGILGPVALLWGLEAVPAGSASLLLNLETTATALIAWLFFQESLGLRAWLANFAVLGAGMLLVSPGGFDLAPAAGLIVLACFFWGLDNNLTAVIDGYTPSQVTVWKGFVAGGTNLAIGLAIERQSTDMGVILAALAVGALAYGASTILYVKGAQQLGAARSQMLFSAAPFFGLGASWMLFGEEVLLVQIIAGLLIAIALAVLLTGRHSHAHRHLAVTHTHTHRHDDGHHSHTHTPPVEPGAWHSHEHSHDSLEHAHEHMPDLHHRHDH
ncbi:MAG: EamA family transporter [Myxococcota bacterium]|nr:EamA family transporter [Myxococcota bacterium]